MSEGEGSNWSALRAAARGRRARKDRRRRKERRGSEGLEEAEEEGKEEKSGMVWKSKAMAERSNREIARRV